MGRGVQDLQGEFPSIAPSTACFEERCVLCPQEKQHFIVVDMAYQGFATGELDKDAAGLRLLARDGHQMAFCQSFAKNMGLYGNITHACTCTCTCTPCACISVHDHISSLEGAMELKFVPFCSS